MPLNARLGGAVAGPRRHAGRHGRRTESKRRSSPPIPAGLVDLELEPAVGDGPRGTDFLPAGATLAFQRHGE